MSLTDEPWLDPRPMLVEVLNNQITRKSVSDPHSAASMEQGVNANRAQSTGPTILPGRPTQQGASFGTGVVQHPNKLYALQARND
uniref:Uncharacterized protein n=1 Tax=Solanum tuberosum TaxID=4113 RepID=M1DFB7_SOLTU